MEKELFTKMTDERQMVVYQDDFVYVWADGWTMRREYTDSPVGNPTHGSWVMRNANGEFVDYDRYRLDLATRYNRKY